MSRKQYGQMSVEVETLDEFIKLRERLHSTNTELLKQMIEWADKRLS